MALTPRSVFRYYETDGVPSSGKHEPIKAEIIQLLEQLFGVSRGGWIVVRTKAELDGITPESETDGGVVLTGADAGYYDRDGGAWVFGRGFPDTFARVELSGSGTAQTGAVATGVVPSTIEVFFAFVGVDNTGPLTLSIAGEPPREVVNLAGNPLAAGEWTGTVMFARDGAQYRMLLDAGAAQSAAQSASDAKDEADRAEAEADRSDAAADRAQNAASAVTSRAWFDYVSTLLADDNDVIGYVGSGADFEVAAGDIIEAQGFRYEVAASDATDAHVETAGGVLLYARPDSENRISSEQFDIPNGTSGPSTQGAFESLVRACREQNAVLFQPDWSNIVLTSTVDVRMTAVDARGQISIVGTDPVLVTGGDASRGPGGAGRLYRNAPTQSFHTVMNSGGASDASIVVKGLMNSKLSVQRSNKILLWADTDSSTDGRDECIAYNEFHFQDITVIELDDNPNTDGDPTQWINENAFYCKRIGQIYIGLNGLYSHNHNFFYTPNLEGSSAQIYIENGDWNQIKDARFEGTPTIRFGSKARDNRVGYSWQTAGDMFRDPNRLWRTPLIISDTVTGEDASGNQVVYEGRERGFACKVFEFNARTHQTFSASASSTNGACYNKLIQAFPTGGFDTVGQSSGSTIVNWTPLLPFKAGWRLLIGADANLFRARVRFYDVNFVHLTNQPDYIVIPSGTWEPAGYFLTTATNNDTFGIECRDTNVHYISFQILGGSMANAFSRLWAFIQPNADLPDTFDKENAFNIEQFGDPTFLSGATPNRGVPYIGQRLNHTNGTGFHRCSFKLSTTASGNRSAGGSSIGVQAIGSTLANDRVAVQLSNGNVLWTYVSGAPSGSEITLGEVLPANVSAGARVEIWRWE